MDEIERIHRMELPVLVGTTNVDVSETLSRMLKRRGITHNVLNAKQHKRESEVVAEAGRPGAVTIATNMAGRGTDIKLGGGVKDRPLNLVDSREGAGARGASAGPILRRSTKSSRAGTRSTSSRSAVCTSLGSERHESRRIDRQLRGRSGRQGDPGASQFFLSLEDDLMRLFGSERIASAMDKMGAEEGEVITHGLVTRSIERAQKRVETNNFEARKRLLDYDDVMNQQREVIYDLRLFALEGGEDLKGEVWEMIEYALRETVRRSDTGGCAGGGVGPGGASPTAPARFLHGGRRVPRERGPGPGAGAGRGRRARSQGGPGDLPPQARGHSGASARRRRSG